MAALCQLAHALRDSGDCARVQSYLAESLALACQVGDRRRIAVTLDLLGTVAQVQGDSTAAQARHEESLAIAREISDPLLLAWTPFNLGCLAVDAGELERAEQLLVESVTIWRSRRATDGLAHALAALASLAHARGMPVEAIRIADATSRLSDTSGCPLAPFYRARFDRLLADLRKHGGHEPAAGMRVEGPSMGLDDAITAAISSVNHQRESSWRAIQEKLPRLTRREQQVIRLVVSGNSNREMGRRLRITEGTARVHVERILAKLNLHSRVQLAIWAIRNGADVKADSD